MKTTAHSIRLLALTGAAALAGLSSARAQNLFVANSSGNTISDYNVSSGTAVAVPFAPAGISGPLGVALSGNTLYVSNSGTNTLNTYNATTGASLSSISAPGSDFGVLPSGGNVYIDTLSGTVSLVNATTGAAVAGFTTITGQVQSTGLALLGNTLYVNNTGSGSPSFVNTFNATTGAPIASPFVMNLGTGANFIAASGNALYVASYGNNAIYGFNATTGAALAGFTTVSDPGSPDGIAAFGGNLYVTNLNTSTVSEYSATTGALVNAAVASGVNGVAGVAVGVVPEPSTWFASLSGLSLLGLVMRQRRARRA